MHLIEYEMVFTELLTLKMKGRNLAIDQMTRFIQLKSLIYNYNYLHCQDWVYLYFKIPCYNFFYYSEIDYIERQISSKVVSKIEKDMKKSRFTFLCCIRRYYKDIRKLLFNHLIKAQNRWNDNNFDKVCKFLKKYDGSHFRK
jgi:hypothetical protein